MTPEAGTIASPTPATLLHTELSMLVTAVWYEIDHGDGAAAAGFFTSDAELTFSRRTFRGTDEINGVYRDRAARGPRVSRHLMSNFHVLRHERGHVEAVSALVLHAQDGTPPIPATVPVLIADVYDHFVRTGNTDEHTSRWRIASRRIENRFLTPGDVLAVPTE
ncbi:nuclear transport factor 2 family protein [Streptomyces boncukensis]|uniref:SnoaL-like domain-containing protein n=1 Tax=Streptomyces boncukensis TaxID=2711219 RepID=A0A6G4X2W4_9ACTN|nr:nuclear transport factor 2 family protein [Streptomyces boncukensis]NGO71879.1 SnoaL-like domain-containing protein [Streptomyces boncukensis]